MSQLKEAQTLTLLRKKLAEVAHVRAIRKQAEADAAKKKADDDQAKADGFVLIRRQKRKLLLDGLDNNPKSLLEMDQTVGRVNRLGEHQQELFQQARSQNIVAQNARDASILAQRESMVYQKRENASQILLDQVKVIALAEEEASELKEIEDISKAMAALPPPEEI